MGRCGPRLTDPQLEEKVNAKFPCNHQVVDATWVLVCIGTYLELLNPVSRTRDANKTTRKFFLQAP